MCKNKLGQRAHIQATVMVSRVPLNPSICTRHALTWPVKDAVKEKRFGTFGEFDQEDFVTSGKFSEFAGAGVIKILKSIKIYFYQCF